MYDKMEFSGVKRWVVPEQMSPEIDMLEEFLRNE
jgi:hypothetical protein